MQQLQHEQMIQKQIEDPYANSPLIAGPRSRLMASGNQANAPQLDPNRRESNEEVKEALMGIVQQFNTKGDPRNADKVMNFINQMK